MQSRLDHRDRLRALAENVRPDRTPVSLWRHFYKDEDDLDSFIEAMVWWQKTYDWDFMKINPRASYHYEPWGVKMRPSPNRQIKPERVGFPVQTPDDWTRVAPLSVNHPLFDFQLRAIKRIRQLVPKPFPIVMTVFNPISILGDMVESDDLLIRSLGEQPELVHSALSAVTNTFVNLVHDFRNAGADGIFFATTQWASTDRLNVEELKTFALPYDREVWAAAGDDAFNVLHVCEQRIYLSEYGEFGAALTNWDVALEGNPSLQDAHAILRRPVMGGIHHNTDLVNDSPETLTSKVRHLVDEHREIPYVVGPGCAIPVTTPEENIVAVRQAVDL